MVVIRREHSALEKLLQYASSMLRKVWSKRAVLGLQEDADKCGDQALKSLLSLSASVTSASSPYQQRI